MTSAATKVLVAAAVLLGVAVLAPLASAAPPVNTAPPTITGTPSQGSTLTAQNGTWDNNPTAFQYQWRRCDASGGACTNIAGAVQRTYMVTGADAGRTLRVRVTAVNADGATNAISAPTAVVSSPGAPRNTERPTITGTPQVGNELTAENGTWTGNPDSFTYQWQRCDIDGAVCTDVTGATGRTYGVRGADVGFRLRVAVTARTAQGSNTANSALTAVAGPSAPITNQRPSIQIVSIRFLGSRVYARVRICDDTRRNLTILERDSRPGVRVVNRRFSTLAPPSPCGVYTRNWLPGARFLRAGGRYTVTLWARDTSGLTSRPAARTFRR